jgi:hypothetical protein
MIYGWRTMQSCQRAARPLTPQSQMAAYLACLLHDIGGEEEDDGHARAGAVFAFQYLHDKGFAQDVIELTCRAILCHRTSDFLGLDLEKEDPSLPVTVVADKWDQWRWRVRWLASRIEEMAATEGRAWIDHETDLNAVITWAIVRHEVISRKHGEWVELEVDLDEGYATPGKFLELFGRRYRASRLAAGHLGLGEYTILINSVQVDPAPGVHPFIEVIDKVRYRWCNGQWTAMKPRF